MRKTAEDMKLGAERAEERAKTETEKAEKAHEEMLAAKLEMNNHNEEMKVMINHCGLYMF